MSAALRCLQEALTELKRMDDREPEKAMLVETMESIIRERDVSDAVKLAKAQRELSTMRQASARKAVTEKLNREHQERIAFESEGYKSEHLRAFVDKIEESSDPTIRRDGASAASKQRTYEKKYQNKLRPAVEDFFTGTFFKRPKDTQNLSRELLGFDTGDPIAKRAAKIIREVNEELRSDLRAAGVFVDDMLNHRPQNRSPGRMARDPERYKREFAALVDPERHPNPEATAEADFTKHMTRHTLEPGDQPLTMKREIHFRTDDPDRLHAFLEEFGEAPLLDQVLRQVRRQTRALALAESFGPDPSSVVKGAIQQFQRNIAAENLPARTRAKNETVARGAIGTFDALSGALDTPQNALGANVMSGLRAFVPVLYLGRTVFSIIGTDSLIAPLQRATAEGFGRAFSLQARGAMALMNKDLRTRLQDYYNAYELFMHFGSPNSRFSLDMGAEGFAAKAQQFSTGIYRMSGALDVEQGLRQMTSYSLGRGMGDTAKVPWNELDPRLQQDFANGGITSRIWDEVNANGQVDEYGLLNWSNLSRDTQTVLGAYFHRALEQAVLRPNNFTRGLLFAGGRRGSLPGELARSFTQLLNWPIAFTQIAMQRQLKSGLPGAAVFSGALFTGGLVTEQLYAISRNEPAFEWTSATLIERAARRSGLMTPVGEWMYGMATDNDFMKPDLGVLYSTLEDTMRRSGRLSVRLAEGESDKAAMETMDLFRGLTPNTWWLEQILLPTYQNMQQTLDPESVRRQRRRFREEDRMGTR